MSDHPEDWRVNEWCWRGVWASVASFALSGLGAEFISEEFGSGMVLGGVLAAPVFVLLAILTAPPRGGA